MSPISQVEKLRASEAPVSLKLTQVVTCRAEVLRKGSRVQCLTLCTMTYPGINMWEEKWGPKGRTEPLCHNPPFRGYTFPRSHPGSMSNKTLRSHVELLAQGDRCCGSPIFQCPWLVTQSTSTQGSAMCSDWAMDAEPSPVCPSVLPHVWRCHACHSGRCACVPVS